MTNEAIRDLVLERSIWRKAIKRFDPSKKVSDADFAYILELARMSPSSIGYEPWKFLVVQNPEIRAELSEFMPGAKFQLESASHFVLLLADKNARYDDPEYLERMQRARNLAPEMYEKVVAAFHNYQVNVWGLFENERAMFDWSAKQCYIALANMMTGAAMIEVDSCPIEGFIGPEVQKILVEKHGLYDGERYAPCVAVAFGYRDGEGYGKARKPAEDVVIWAK